MTADRSSKTIGVLVVEDEPGDLALLRRMLDSSEGVRFHITHAARLSDALQKVGHRIDIVLLDLNLPDSQSLDTLRIMRLTHPSVPIIVMTGMEDRTSALDALANGAKDYLIKGKIDNHLLLKAILRHLQSANIPPESVS
jgi:CheY-like chemotaxis protein